MGEEPTPNTHHTETTDPILPPPQTSYVIAPETSYIVIVSSAHYIQVIFKIRYEMTSVAKKMSSNFHFWVVSFVQQVVCYQPDEVIARIPLVDRDTDNKDTQL